jgi:membrane protease YdiL (CAAX protease family)
LSTPIPAALPTSPPPVGQLIAGFALLAGGLALLTPRRGHRPLRSAAGTARVLGYILVYALSTLCFMRVLAPALLGRVESPWLMALGDVLCVTIGLFIWVVALAERHPLRDYGLHGAAPARLTLATVMGLGSVLVVSFGAWQQLLTRGAMPNSDVIVFAIAFAVLGSAIPDELLFRGLLMTSLNGRYPRWWRVAAPALIFTAVRSLRFLPGQEMPLQTWLAWVLGAVLPLGLWWGLMRDLAGGSIWPGLVSHALIEFGTLAAGPSRPGNPFAH